MTAPKSRIRSPREWATEPTNFGRAPSIPLHRPENTVAARAERRAAQLQNDMVAAVRDILKDKSRSARNLALSDNGVGLSEWALRRVLRGETEIQLTTATALGVALRTKFIFGPVEYGTMWAENILLARKVAAYERRLAERGILPPDVGLDGRPLV